MSAQDANRWTLNFEEQYSRGGATGTDTAINNILNNSAYGSTTSLALTIPIDNKSNQETVLSAKIALETAELDLKQQKQDLIIQVMSAQDGLVNDAEQIKLAQNQADYDNQALQNTLRSYHAGMASSLQVAQQSQTYANDQRAIINVQISYFNSLAAFDELYGHTLNTWGIHMQY